jgi:hypothetical protein
MGVMAEQAVMTTLLPFMAGRTPPSAPGLMD